MKLAFGALIATILLFLYAFSVIFAVGVAMELPWAKGAEFNSGFASTLSTIGGLVSALVIAELAVIKPGETPGTRALESKAISGEYSARAVTVITIAYFSVWVLLGLTSYIVGVLLYPDVVADLTNHGLAWLGLAVAAAYAYFGLTPGK